VIASGGPAGADGDPHAMTTGVNRTPSRVTFTQDSPDELPELSMLLTRTPFRALIQADSVRGVYSSRHAA
jgi:hypothetical protein